MTRTDTPALAAPPVPQDRGSHRAAAGDTLLTAQSEARRGLRAGAAALVHAKSAYGEAQWSGEHDRRPEPGLLVKARL